MTVLHKKLIEVALPRRLSIRPAPARSPSTTGTPAPCTCGGPGDLRPDGGRPSSPETPLAEAQDEDDILWPWLSRRRCALCPLPAPAIPPGAGLGVTSVNYDFRELIMRGRPT